MGYALIWVEGLAVALLALALATAWAVRGGIWRWGVVTLVGLAFLAPAAYFAYSITNVLVHSDGPVRTTWLAYVLSWLVVLLAGSAFVVWRGTGRPSPEAERQAMAWPMGQFGLWFGGAALAFAMTFWNMDLAARADLAIARQEAGAFLMGLAPPPAASEGGNAALLYSQAVKELTEPVEEPWSSAARNGFDAEVQADWKAGYPAELVKRHAAALALMRKAAALPRCHFDYQAGPLDVVMEPTGAPRWPARGATLLAIDARVEAARGNLRQAFADITALLGFARHVQEYHTTLFVEVMAWRALEDVLRLAPADKNPFPALDVPELPALTRLVRREQALLGIVLCAAASQPSLVREEFEKRDGPLVAFVVECGMAPLARVFIIPDELAAMRRLFEEHRKSPRSARDEAPGDWAEIRKSVENDPTSLYGIKYVKPKHKVLLREGTALATLRQTARAALAAEAYQRKYGRYPERLEQLVPEFLPGVPTGPRDGQVLRFKRVSDAIVFFAPQEADAVDAGKASRPQGRWLFPVFRIFPRPPAR